MAHTPPRSIALIGMGPRGISVLERLAALTPQITNEATPITVHAIDDAQHGAGRIWETDQTHTLCMNTLAGAVTLFTEPGASVHSPVVEGPTMYEWIQLLRDTDADSETSEAAVLSREFPAKVALFNNHRPDESVLQEFAEEIVATRPESNPSRALYGAYLNWVYHVALALLPDNVTVINHVGRATSIAASDTSDTADIITITHSDGSTSTVESEATVIASGWRRPDFNSEETLLADAVSRNEELTWIQPGNPVEQAVDAIPESGDVLVRGMGMGFYDVMALLTFNRGGTFENTPETRSGLTYRPSGKEPRLLVSSGRGYPFMPKSDYRSLPPRSPHRRLQQALQAVADVPVGANSIDFAADILPAVARDSFEDYFRTLARVQPEALKVGVDEITAIIDATDLTTAAQANSTTAILDALSAATEHVSTQPFAPSRYFQPLAEFSGDTRELTEHVADMMAHDIAEASAGHDSAEKAGHWALSSARKAVSIAGSQARYTRESRTGAYKEFMGFGQMAGSGPPLFRSRQLLALVDAGLVEFLGERPQLVIEDASGTADSPAAHPAFVLRSGQREARSSTLVDAWMHSPDIRRANDSLSKSLLSAQRVRPFVDGKVATGSPEVDPVTRRVIGTNGEVDPRIHIIGIPTYAQMPDTTISPMPGTDPLFLQETDKTVAAILGLNL